MGSIAFELCTKSNSPDEWCEATVAYGFYTGINGEWASCMNLYVYACTQSNSCVLLRAFAFAFSSCSGHFSIFLLCVCVCACVSSYTANIHLDCCRFCCSTNVFVFHLQRGTMWEEGGCTWGFRAWMAFGVLLLSYTLLLLLLWTDVFICK